MNARAWVHIGLLLSAISAAPAFSQEGGTPVDTTTAGTAPDSTAAASAVPAAAVSTRASRASWLSDRLPLRAGDLVTVVVDEQTAAREHVSNIAQGNRSQRADLNAGIGTDLAVGPGKSFGAGMRSDTRDVGDAGRSANFTAVLTCRVLEVSPNGIAKISGTKRTTIDGRVQDVTLTGSIRAEDVNVHNQVRSDAIVDAMLNFKGKKIGPRTGILGSIINILWP